MNVATSKRQAREFISGNSIEIKGEKGGILYNVRIAESKNSYYEMHIDADDANAHNIKQNDEVDIIV